MSYEAGGPWVGLVSTSNVNLHHRASNRSSTSLKKCFQGFLPAFERTDVPLIILLCINLDATGTIHSVLRYSTPGRKHLGVLAILRAARAPRTRRARGRGLRLLALKRAMVEPAGFFLPATFSRGHLISRPGFREDHMFGKLGCESSMIKGTAFTYIIP